MYARSRGNLSLWPEQARPRRRPLKFAVGSFVLGLACATGYAAFFNFPGLAASGAPKPVEHRPVYAGADTAPVATRPAITEPERSGSGIRPTVAKVKLPIIGSHLVAADNAEDGPVVPLSALDRGSSERLVGEAPVEGSTNPAASVGKVRDQGVRTTEQTSSQGPSAPANPAAAANVRARKASAEKRAELVSVASERQPAVESQPASAEAKSAARERKIKPRKTVAKEKPAKSGKAERLATRSGARHDAPNRHSGHRRQDGLPSVEVALRALRSFSFDHGIFPGGL